MSLELNIRQTLSTILHAAHNAHRRPADITCLAVSKTRTPEEMRQAYDAGLRHFGENYLQEALAKITTLAALDITWHFIGAIQSNKTREIANQFTWVHTVDRLSIAERLSRQRATALPPLNVCVQVNIDNEPQKSGVLADDLADLLASINELPHLRLRGLMAIPAPGASRSSFQRMHALFREMQQQGYALDTLSMGMTADFEMAITEGATMVRIGEGIFGKRTVPRA